MEVEEHGLTALRHEPGRLNRPSRPMGWVTLYALAVADSVRCPPAVGKRRSCSNQPRLEFLVLSATMKAPIGTDCIGESPILAQKV